MVVLGVVFLIVGVMSAIIGLLVVLVQINNSTGTDSVFVGLGALLLVCGIFLITSGGSTISHTINREKCIAMDYTEVVYVEKEWYCVDPGSEPRIERLQDGNVFFGSD